jgi:hypothetical protein
MLIPPLNGGDCYEGLSGVSILSSSANPRRALTIKCAVNCWRASSEFELLCEGVEVQADSIMTPSITITIFIFLSRIQYECILPVKQLS